MCVWGGGGGQGSEYWGGGANQCQVIEFLTLKANNIAKLRIEMKSILLEIHAHSYKIKGTYTKLVLL